MRRRKSGREEDAPQKARNRDGPLVGAFFLSSRGRRKLEQISVCGLLLNVPYVLNALYFVGEHYTEKQ